MKLKRFKNGMQMNRKLDAANTQNTCKCGKRIHNTQAGKKIANGKAAMGRKSLQSNLCPMVVIRWENQRLSNEHQSNSIIGSAHQSNSIIGSGCTYTRVYYIGTHRF
ncbi:unnamed protein product [Cuscuta epithymum]|uniref:Uncharacterized protein n=1 Tax=Cuscuta epithymum TaxID=186058 RepID=A0AAV0F7Y8_9ASTE|nr:unnamed protein product [Cuscuta epithymum]